MTGLLFETSPEEPEKKRPKRHAPHGDQVVADEPDVTTAAPAASFCVGPIEYRGRCDNEYECIDESCGCGAHDVVDGGPGRWRIQCFACGTIQTVASLPTPPAKPPAAAAVGGPGQQVFGTGIFAGLTIAEAWGRPRGPDYIAYAATEFPNQNVREACKAWLAQNQPVG